MVIIVDLHLVDPNVAIQQIVDDISDELSALLPWPHVLEVASPWREVQIMSSAAKVTLCL